ncbi:AfaD family invasin [Pseudomonas savastanoi]|uniref:AfaD family invasin n=1 Tax=Pseudomonas savastanoi TaxID=29438 RepID=UPI000F007260|nr:AfaD family invasin [Pseudomonas savastanoi]
MTEVITKKIRQAIALLTLLITVSPSIWASVPTLKLQPAAGLRAGHIRNGALVMIGQVNDPGIHTGFRIQQELQADTGRPQVLRLHGLRDSTHILQVRLEGQGWQPDPRDVAGQVTYVTDNSVQFRLVADGDQTVAADSWEVAISAIVIK